MCGFAILCGYGFSVRAVENCNSEFCWLRLTEEWFRFSKLKKQSVGAICWWTLRSQIKYSWFAISRPAVAWMAYRTFLRCQRQLERSCEAQRERQPARERQRVEC